MGLRDELELALAQMRYQEHEAWKCTQRRQEPTTYRTYWQGAQEAYAHAIVLVEGALRNAGEVTNHAS